MSAAEAVAVPRSPLRGTRYGAARGGRGSGCTMGAGAPQRRPVRGHRRLLRRRRRAGVAVVRGRGRLRLLPARGHQPGGAAAGRPGALARGPRRGRRHRAGGRPAAPPAARHRARVRGRQHDRAAGRRPGGRAPPARDPGPAAPPRRPVVPAGGVHRRPRGRGADRRDDQDDRRRRRRLGHVGVPLVRGRRRGSPDHRPPGPASVAEAVAGGPARSSWRSARS